MKRVIVTVVGKDTVGIIAKVCTYLAGVNVNVLDISQTILQGYFNMIMIVDTAACTLNHGELAGGLAGLGEDMGLVITCQREEIFEKMHRI